MAAQSGNAKPATTDPTDTAEARQANADAVEKQESATPGKAADLTVKAKRADGKPLTTLDDDVSHPGVVSPGDTPHDTVLPAEHASSVTPDKATASREGYGVVNAVVPIRDPSGALQARAAARGELEGSEHRTEKYQATAPNGENVTVEHNLDTGETRVV